MERMECDRIEFGVFDKLRDHDRARRVVVYFLPLLSTSRETLRKNVNIDL